MLALRPTLADNNLQNQKSGEAKIRSSQHLQLVRSIRLVTELAHAGNFVECQALISDIDGLSSITPLLVSKLTDTLVSRDVSVIKLNNGSRILSIHRQLGHKSPAIVSCTVKGNIGVEGLTLNKSGIDHVVVAPNGTNISYSIGKQLFFKRKPDVEAVRTDGHDANVRLVATSDDGSVVATYGDDAFVRIWDSSNGTPLTSIALRDVRAPYLSISPSGEIVCVAVSNGPAKYLNLKGDGEAHTLRPRGTHATAICPFPNGRAFVVGCLDGTTHIMEMKMGRESAILDGDGSAVIHVSITADGRRMLVQTRSGRISVYETANAERTHIWQLPPDTRTIFAEFTTNNNIAFASTNNTVRTIALSEKDLWQSLMLPKVELTDALLCQNDQILICGDSSGRLINVTTKTGLVTPPVQCHRRRIHNIRQHPQNPRFVTMASWDNTASIVDIASLEPVMMFVGHADRVRDAMISPDGLVMVTVADDRTCRFWDARTGKSLHVSTLPERPLAIETCTGLSAAVVDVSGNRLSIQRGKVKPVSVVKGRFEMQLTNVIGNSRSVTYLDGCRVVTLDSNNKRFKEFTSSDRITAASSHESAPILALGTSTGLIQILESSSLTHLLDMKCTNCQIASVGYSKSGDFMYAIGVDGQLNYLRLQGPKR